VIVASVALVRKLCCPGLHVAQHLTGMLKESLCVRNALFQGSADVGNLQLGVHDRSIFV
jgi:hypothetical protein